MTPQEPDFEPGHPARGDYDPTSPEAIAWALARYSPLGDRDFPMGHPKAVDTPGNQNHIPALPGVNPDCPELEPFSGRTPAQVAAHLSLQQYLAKSAKETPIVRPIVAPDPPEPIERPLPVGQPGE
jgi:hypothetical protein